MLYSKVFDRNIVTNPETVFIIGASLLSLGFYTVSLAVLTDMHTARWQCLRLTNRIFDGAIVGAVIGIAEIAQFTLVALLANREAPLQNFSGSHTIFSGSLTISAVWMSVVFGFAIGAYVPVTASRYLLQAKSILDQCSTDVRRLN